MSFFSLVSFFLHLFPSFNHVKIFIIFKTHLIHKYFYWSLLFSLFFLFVAHFFISLPLHLSIHQSRLIFTCLSFPYSFYITCSCIYFSLWLIISFLPLFLFIRLLINSYLPFSPPVHFYHSTFLPVYFTFLHILLFSSPLLLINSSHNLSFHLFSSINQLFFFTWHFNLLPLPSSLNQLFTYHLSFPPVLFNQSTFLPALFSFTCHL